MVKWWKAVFAHETMEGAFSGTSASAFFFPPLHLFTLRCIHTFFFIVHGLVIGDSGCFVPTTRALGKKYNITRTVFEEKNCRLIASVFLIIIILNEQNILLLNLP